MTIAFTKYVDIASSVGGANIVPITELITRIFSVNPLIPTGGVALQFTSAAAVGSYFGTASEEYLRALFYFTWVSKTFQSPQKISFSIWADAATAPLIYGASLSTFNTVLATFTAINNGAFALTIGGVTEQISGLDFTGAGDFATVAGIIQTAVRAANTGVVWTAADVTYSATPGAFNFVGGDVGPYALSVAAPTAGTDIHTLMGWATSALIYPSAPIFSNGVAIETITQTLTNSAGLSDNFGSYVFTNSSDLTTDEIVESSMWNLAQNNEYIYLAQVTASNATELATDLNNIGGTALTLQSPAPVTATEYPEMAPGMIMAATNYAGINAVQNYMFQIFNLTPSVTSTSVAQGYDAIGINYYGLTQTNGQLLTFYQNGYLSGAGIPTNALDMNVYANECWFKNAASAALGTLLLSVSQIPANQQGRSLVINTLQIIIGQAVNNGVISVGAELTPAQISTITSVTGDSNAWYQIQDIGYWLDAVITQSGSNYIITYTLVYKKNDVIRQITGTDILI